MIPHLPRPSRLQPMAGAFFLALMVYALTLADPSAATAKSVVSCAGAALSGGAQLVCNHLDPTAPAQLCTYSWALATPANDTQVINGTALIPPGANNVTVYQGAGFAHAMSEPIVMCQGKRRQPMPKR